MLILSIVRKPFYQSLRSFLKTSSDMFLLIVNLDAISPRKDLSCINAELSLSEPIRAWKSLYGSMLLMLFPSYYLANTGSEGV